MAATVSWDSLRDLAGFRAAKGIAVSLYLDLDPSTMTTPGDVAARAHALLGDAAKQLDRGELTREQRQGLKADLEHIQRYLQEELVRDGARGLAVFTSELDNLWRPLALTESVPDAVKVESALFLTPLIPLVGRGDGALVAVVGRERGELLRLHAGRLEPVVDRTEDQPGKHDQGGWSQARFQRHIEHLVHEHLERVAEELARRVRRHAERIVVVSTEETRAAFDDLLTKEARDAIVGWTTAEAHAGPRELLAAATPVLEAWRAREEERAVQRWHDEAGRNGRAASGWAATLEAASDGRVDLLLYRNGVEHPAWRCPSCGRLAAGAGTCPLDGTRMDRTEDGLDLAVHHALSNGGTVWAVTTRQDLDPVEGIGALLRY
jgi:peptide chain release factor subunit 1